MEKLVIPLTNRCPYDPTHGSAGQLGYENTEIVSGETSHGDSLNDRLMDLIDCYERIECPGTAFSALIALAAAGGMNNASLDAKQLWARTLFRVHQHHFSSGNQERLQANIDPLNLSLRQFTDLHSFDNFQLLVSIKREQASPNHFGLISDTSHVLRPVVLEEFTKNCGDTLDQFDGALTLLAELLDADSVDELALINAKLDILLKNKATIYWDNWRLEFTRCDALCKVFDFLGDDATAIGVHLDNSFTCKMTLTEYLVEIFDNESIAKIPPKIRNYLFQIGHEECVAGNGAPYFCNWAMLSTAPLNVLDGDEFTIWQRKFREKPEEMNTILKKRLPRNEEGQIVSPINTKSINGWFELKTWEPQQLRKVALAFLKELQDFLQTKTVDEDARANASEFIVALSQKLIAQLGIGVDAADNGMPEFLKQHSELRGDNE